MKVLIFEPYIGGHHTEYIAHLLPSLLRMKEAGLLEQVIVTVSRDHFESLHFKAELSKYFSTVRFDVVAGFQPYARDSGFRVASMLVNAVRIHKPNYLIATSANYGALPLAARHVLGMALGSGALTSVGIVHHTSLSAAPTLNERLKDATHRLARHFSPWTELQIINPLLFSSISRRASSGAGRVTLLPSPVSAVTPLPKGEARLALDIPADGWYLGHVGGIDWRIALPELLAAFRAADLPGNHRLLLAGQLHSTYRDLIRDHYSDLETSGRLVIRDRFLSSTEVRAAYSSIDVAAVPYYSNYHLSAKALTALAHRRPILASAQGYSGLLVSRFRAGWAFEGLDCNHLKAVIARSVVESAQYHPSAEVERLIEFHDPENYAATVLSRLHKLLGVSRQEPKTWDWVLPR